MKKREGHRSEVLMSMPIAIYTLLFAILIHLNLACMQTIFQTCTLKLFKGGVGLISAGYSRDLKGLTHNKVVMGRLDE